MAEQWQSLRDLAEEFDTPISTLYNLRSAGKGPRGYRIGRELRFRRSDVEEWLASRQDAAPARP
jgi:excisionase family DNA binding protein